MGRLVLKSKYLKIATNHQQPPLGPLKRIRTPFSTSMASSMNSLPLYEFKAILRNLHRRCDRNQTHADSMKTASSNSQRTLRLPVPPNFSGTSCSRITAQRPSKNGLVPGIPTLHQALRNRSRCSFRSSLARGPFGFARQCGMRDPPGAVAFICA